MTRMQFPISLVAYEQRTEKRTRRRRSSLEILMASKRMKFGLRLICTIVLFAVLLHGVSWSLLLAQLREADSGLVLIGIVVGLYGVVVSAYQWQNLLRAEHINLDLRKLVNLYLVGIAFNHFLPTGMGGDVVKAYYVGREENMHAGSASAVIMSRITGFLGMLLLSLPIEIIYHQFFKKTLIIYYLISCLLMCLALGTAFLLVTVLPKLSKRRLFAPVLKIGMALRQSIVRPRAICTATFWGALFFFVGSLNYYCFALALHITTVPVIFYLVAVPFVSLIAFLPISFNGFGIRESAIVYIFSTLNIWHVSPEGSLTLALLMDGQVLLFGLIGGCLYLAMGMRNMLAKEYYHGKVPY